MPDSRPPLFYVPEPEKGLLTGDEAQHLAKVLRLKAGAAIELSDGKGTAFSATVADVRRQEVTYELGKHIAVEQESLPSIALCPPKSPDRLEWFVEKASELGLDSLLLFTSEHSERSRYRKDRLQKKMLAAMKQSQRYLLPTLHELKGLPEVLVWASQQGKRSYIAKVDWPDRLPISQIPAPSESLFIIGPEGDFSSKEMDDAIAAGARAIDMGKAVLRTETAALLPVASAAALRAGS